VSSEEQKTRAIIGIKGYLGDLVKVLTAVNENLVELGQIVKESAEGPSPAWAKKEDPKPCPECRLMFCEIEDCGKTKEGE
jgi:hypothetical protein